MTKRGFVMAIVAEAREEGKRIWGLVRGVKDRASMVKVEEACWELGVKAGRRALGEALEWIEGHRGGMECTCGGGAMQREQRDRDYQTLVGTVWVQRWYYYCRRCGRSASPLDEWLEGGGRMSLGVQGKMAELGADWSFAEAAKKLWRLCRLRVSATAVGNYCRWWAGRSMREGGRVVGARSGQGVDGGERLNVSIDAGKVLTIEGGWRDMKIAYFYDDEQRRRHYVVGIEGADRFGPRVRRAAGRLGLGSTSNLLVRGDGADWIWKLAQVELCGSRQLVDFYHAAAQMGEFTRAVFGEGNAEGRSWLAERLHSLKHEGPRRLLDVLDGMRLHKKAHREARRRLANYISKRIDRMDYPGWLAEGLDIGSGPVESACKRIINERLKGGRRWRTATAVHMANLRSLILSDQWAAFWEQALAA